MQHNKKSELQSIIQRKICQVLKKIVFELNVNLKQGYTENGGKLFF